MCVPVLDGPFPQWRGMIAGTGRYIHNTIISGSITQVSLQVVLHPCLDYAVDQMKAAPCQVACVRTSICQFLRASHILGGSIWKCCGCFSEEEKKLNQDRRRVMMARLAVKAQRLRLGLMILPEVCRAGLKTAPLAGL